MADRFGSKNFTINSLRGGMNVSDPANAIADDEVVLAENVEFFHSMLGERRQGCENVDIGGSGLEDLTFCTWLASHVPAGGELTTSELWAMAAVFAGVDSVIGIARRSGDTWSPVIPEEPPVPGQVELVSWNSASAHGKLFICYRGHNGSLVATNRTYVWDGISLRPVGILPSTDVPSTSNTGSGSMVAEERIYRVRFIIMDSEGHILLRSEPTEEVTFTPSGSGSGVVVTQPTPPGEGETHWELEASSGDGNFYIIDTVPISQGSITDTAELPTDYADIGDLSADIGDYTVPEAHKYVIVDQDRIIWGGSWEDETHNSRITWTPPSNAVGVGNDERIPTDTANFLDLDWQDGGELTGLSDPVNGAFYAFKHSRIYKIQRTGDSRQAYESYLMSTKIGAVYRSIVNGLDEYGRPCVYFLDPSKGPYRVGSQGIQQINGMGEVWRETTTEDITTPCHGVFYPDKNQVHWWVCTNVEADAPTLKLILQVNEIRSSNSGCSRGWTTATGSAATTFASCIHPEITEDEENGGTYLSFRPYVGLHMDDGTIARCDVGNTDFGNTFRAKILTKPYMLAGILNQWGAMNCGVLAKAINSPSTTLEVSFIRDFGKETNKAIIDFMPDDDEEVVLKKLDHLHMSESYAIQIQFQDTDPLPTDD